MSNFSQKEFSHITSFIRKLLKLIESLLFWLKAWILFSLENCKIWFSNDVMRWQKKNNVMQIIRKVDKKSSLSCIGVKFTIYSISIKLLRKIKQTLWKQITQIIFLKGKSE